MPPEVVAILARDVAAKLQAHLDKDVTQFDELRRARLIGFRIAVAALLVAAAGLISNVFLWSQVSRLHAAPSDASAPTE